MRAIEYVSYADAIGYGIAAAGYVRLLVEAGYRVHWQPYPNDAVWFGRVGPAHERVEFARGRSMLLSRAQSGRDNAMQGLLEATSRPVDAKVRIVHLLPPFWPQHMSPAPRVRHLGMTVWETDRVDPRWLAPLRRMDHLCVPSRHSVAVMQDAVGPAPTVSLAPHLAPPGLRPPSPARMASLAKWLRVTPEDTVFYTISAWDPRKRLAALIEGFARTFRADDKVVLAIKTSRQALYDDPAAPGAGRVVAQMAAAILDRVGAELGRPPPRISLIADDEVADAVIDGLHSLGHCYVSLSRCEGFGLGGFDAAAHGRPVIAVGYGGPVDYLGPDWPGSVPFSMTPCEALPGYTWFDEAQSWPQPDDEAAFALMRRFAADRGPFLAHAAATKDHIAAAFGPEAITGRLVEALDTIG